MNRITPGPWTLHEYGFQQIEGYALHGGDDATILYCDDSYCLAYIRNEADARVIAAAPDLLDALKGVVRVADRQTTEFNAARVAIARAEGTL